MPGGVTTTLVLADSLPEIINQARQVQEHAGVMTQVADKVKLGEGQGNTWQEISLAQLIAQSITETTESDNPQQIDDTAFPLTPSVIEVHTVITKKTARNISKNVFAKIGGLAQNAIERKKDTDGIAAMDGFTTSLAGTGTTLTTGHVAAGTSRIQANTTEGWSGATSAVLHGYQIKDLFDELVAGVGTYPIPAGSTADVFKGGFHLPIMETAVFTDNNIPIDATPDAKGGVFASGPGGALVLCQARAPWVDMVENKKLGGGATEVLHRDEYAWGERSAGNWGFELYSDATVPTS